MPKKLKAPDYVITNMVASASLGLELDLYSLALKIPKIDYEPDQFPGAILKFDKPKASLLLFKNGKVVCVGCKDKKTIEEVINKTVKMLRPHARKILKTKKPKIDITNIVAAADLHLELDLYRIAYRLRDVEYEPDQFPGAILKFDKPKASLLLFKNGKAICAGAKNEEEIKEVLKKAQKMLAPYAGK